MLSNSIILHLICDINFSLKCTHIFNLNIDKHLFRSTNNIWNALKLNDPWSVGYVTSLIDNPSITDESSWEAFYYNSGMERKNILAALSTSTQDILNNRLLPYSYNDIFDTLSKDMKAINYNYGRSKTDLQYKAEILHHHCKKSNINSNIDQIQECVCYRIIGETWNGIILREKNTIDSLVKIYPTLEFEKTEASFDHQYAVDYNAYLGTRLVCGIQIKPKSFLSNKSYILKAKRANATKNKKYSKEFGVPSIDIISSQKGQIYNLSNLKVIKELL